MTDGLNSRHREVILQVLTHHPRVERIILFGSRATGSFTPTSDIDLALEGNLTLNDQADLADKLDALVIPYTIDLVRVATITTPALVEHIKHHGKTWWSRPTSSFCP